MKKLLLFIFFIPNLYSFQWPSNTNSINYLFGTITEGFFLDGIEYSPTDQIIYPVADGEVIYYSDGFDFGENKSKNKNNFLYIKHEGNFDSMYRNFTNLDEVQNQEYLKSSEPIGATPLIGKSFSFSIYDGAKKEIINPLQILPLLTDNQRPIINNVRLFSKEKEYNLTNNLSVISGAYEIEIDTYDVMVIGKVIRKVSPFQFNVFVDGFEVYNGTLSGIKRINFNLFIPGSKNIPINYYKDLPWKYYGGEIFLTRGRSIVEVVVKDANGNESSRSIPINILNP